MQRSTRIGVLMIGSCLAAPLPAQIIGRQDQIGLTVRATDKLASRQVFAIAPSQFVRTIESQLTAAGIDVAASKESMRLIIGIDSYDSGPYLGLSKTARIAVSYELRKASGDPIESWSDRCESKVGLDAQDAPDRNRTAVLLCLTKLGARLAEKLAGPPAEVMVR